MILQMMPQNLAEVLTEENIRWIGYTASADDDILLTDTSELKLGTDAILKLSIMAQKLHT